MKSILELAKEATQPKPVEPVIKRVFLSASVSISPDELYKPDWFDNGYFDVFWTPVDESVVADNGDFDCHCAQDIDSNCWHVEDPEDPQVIISKSIVKALIDRVEDISDCELIMYKGEYLELSKIKKMLK